MPDVAIVSPERDKVFARMLALELEAKKGISSVCTDYISVPFNGLKLIIVSSEDAMAMTSLCEKAAAKHIPCITFGYVDGKSARVDFPRPFLVEPLVEKVCGFLFPAGERTAVSEAAPDFSLDYERKAVIYGKSTVELSQREYDLLSYLYENRDRAVSRAELRENVWKTDASSNNTDVYINYLRRKLDEKFNKKFIFTIRGEGYRLKI